MSAAGPPPAASPPQQGSEALVSQQIASTVETDEARSLRQYVPLLQWIRTYDRSNLGSDVVAGLTVWGLVVPAGMGYASLAGLPPQAGLYTILVSLIAYALFGTSRHVVVAATSASAALIGSTLAALDTPDDSTYIVYGAALVMLVGLLFLLAGIARLGFIAQFLSRPIMSGFVVGLAIFVAVGQLNKVFGVSGGSGNTFEKLAHVISEFDETNWWTLTVGVISLALLFGLPRLTTRAPAGLVVLGGMILLSTVLDLADQHGVDVVGELPRGLPSVDVPSVDLSLLWALLPAAAGIVLVAYSEALGVAKSFAMRHGYDIDPDQELRAFGVVNLATGMVGGLVACGGMSPSAVNEGAGARSQISSITAGAMVLVTVLVLTPLFTNLPQAVLAALIINAVSHMMRTDELRAVRRLAPVEFWLGITALVGVLVFGVLQGLVIAMVASLLVFVYGSSKPSVVRLGAIPGDAGEFVALGRHPDAVATPGVVVLRLDRPMYYANAPGNADAVKRLVSADPSASAVVFDLGVQHEFDFTSIETTRQILDWLHTRNLDVYLSQVHSEIVAQAEFSGLIGESLPPDRIVRSLSDAVLLARAQRPDRDAPAAEPPDDAAVLAHEDE
jgi:sulfate permease, SulP family